MKQVKANFKLKEPNADAPSLIFMKFYWNSQRLTYSTGIKIHPKYWDERSNCTILDRYERVKKELKYSSSEDLIVEKKELETLIKLGKQENPSFELDMNNYAVFLNRYEDELGKAYSYLLNQEEPITPDSIKTLLDKKFKPEATQKPVRSEFYRRFDEFIESRRSTSSILTIKKFNTLITKIQEFEKKKRYRISFDSINLVFYDKFKSYMLSEKNKRTDDAKGLLDDTISKYFSALKTYMQWALDRNYHTNTDFQHNHFSAKKKTKNEIVTLTEEELERLEKVDLANIPRLERIRDLFCFATRTGQRWSDIENFKKEDIKDGWWIFQSYKTKELMKIPFNGFIAPALDILEKYNYKLPEISAQKFNDYIKEVGEEAEINESITIRRSSGKQRLEIRKPKYAFMSSHMARRSFVTILLQKGVPPTTIMKLTGHKDLKTLMKYENTGDEAVVDALEELT